MKTSTSMHGVTTTPLCNTNTLCDATFFNCSTMGIKAIVSTNNERLRINCVTGQGSLTQVICSTSCVFMRHPTYWRINSELYCLSRTIPKLNLS